MPALYEMDCNQAGFEWLINDANKNVFAWMRKGDQPRSRCLVIVNFSPNVYRHYRVRVPFHGRWIEIFNSDSASYGGNNVGNGGEIHAPDEIVPRLTLTLPPLAALFIVPEQSF